MKSRFAIGLSAVVMIGALGGNAAYATNAQTKVTASECVSANSVLETRVRNDHRIDFHIRGGQRLINRLPASCRNLDYEKKYSLAKPGDRICAGDSIVVANRTHGPGEPSGATCALGSFTSAHTDTGS